MVVQTGVYCWNVPTCELCKGVVWFSGPQSLCVFSSEEEEEEEWLLLHSRRECCPCVTDQHWLCDRHVATMTPSLSRSKKTTYASHENMISKFFVLLYLELFESTSVIANKNKETWKGN